jgi:hypothetical protein
MHMPTPAEFADLSGQAAHRKLTGPRLELTLDDVQPATTTTNDRSLVPCWVQAFISPRNGRDEQATRNSLRSW